MKTRLLLIVCSLLVACQQADEPAAGPGPQPQGYVEATAAEHRDDAPVATPAVVPEPAQPVLDEALAYGEGNKTNLVGYLAAPADAVEPLPGIIVIHEWWGLNDNIKAMTRRLAGEGYIALAVDLYGGETAEDPAAAQALMAGVMAAPEAAIDNLRQAYEYLDKYALAPSVGAVGWCLGGAWSLRTALALPSELDAMVMYYGEVVTDPDQLAPLSMPILGLFGALDESIPAREVETFRKRLNELGKRSNVIIYPRVGHAFANPSGGTYDAMTADKAWQETLAFLRENLPAQRAP
jgi:carboxymethylenebutenolidase